jgi:glycine betaine/proline transport system substrate-binding protein
MVMAGLLLTLCACRQETSSQTDTASASQAAEPVEIVYVDWASEKASANVVKAVIEERLNRDCSLLDVTLIAMWEAIAAGDKDGMVAAWLPSLQARYLDQYADQVELAGKNLQGTRIGLVVPEYVDIDSIPELRQHAGRFDGKIIGIDPHAGLMEKTAQAIDSYGLDSYQLVSGSGPTMTTTLKEAIQEQRWVVVTGWTPHWKFAKWDLKYLEDPKNVYGDKEYIGTVVRPGLSTDMPEVYSFLKSFRWQPSDMEQVMLWARQEGMTCAQAARRWVKAHPGLVDRWLDRQPDAAQ